MRNAARRTGALAAGTAALTLLGVVLAVTRPPWLTGPLQAAVTDSGALAPALYLLLCVVGAPLHLNGLLGALSTVSFPLPLAWALTWAGTTLGSVLTGAALFRLGHASRQDGPAWLQRLAAGVARRPVLSGLLARLALGSGAALEAFFVLGGYRWGQYLLITVVGSALWSAQTLFGVTLLRQLAQGSPLLAGVLALFPLILVGAVARWRRTPRAGGAA
ncbi:TVP38/TMEM64 family protein [Deinococcus aquaedulcis]|uniref:hypothetical protein n=1 Tax=Deinococcus aquaedulcis TaxID=2840455 RepID=UPI001C83F139|nr:hypothetical protein [Deinococcus aquaedulcis]